MSELVRLAWRAEGSGEPVLVLHGLLGQGRNWQSIARRLASRYRLMLVDLRNHGASPWSDLMTYEAMADDLIGLIEAEGLEQPAVIGHSMGGKVAMTLALRHPDRVGSLVIVDVAPVRYTGHGFEAYLAGMAAIDPTNRRRAEVEADLAAIAPDPLVRAFLASNLGSPGGRLRWQPNLAALEGALPELMDFPAVPEQVSFGGPTLFLRGGRSDYVRDEHLPVIHSLFPKARLETITQAGHWVHADAPIATAGVIQDFLAEPPGD